MTANKNLSLWEQLILETASGYVKDEKVIRCSQHGFTKRKSCLTSLITYDEMTTVINEGRWWILVYLDFSKDFDTILCKILIE